MKAIKFLTILASIFLYLSGFSQSDSLSAVNKSEVKRFHKKIFQLPVDKTIDSMSTYTLRYSFAKGWKQGPNNPNHNKEYKSKYAVKSSAQRKIPVIDFLTYPSPPEGSSQETYLFVKAEIASSGKDELYKILKKRKFDNELVTGIVSLGGKYLLVAKKTTYIGNNSWSITEYLYYEKVE